MCLRISSTLAALATLAACADESPPPPGDTVECALGVGAELSPVCSLERIAAQDELILHHPDGGFRRLTHDRATGELAALDGADPLIMETRGADAVQFAVGPNHYRVSRSLLAPPPK